MAFTINPPNSALIDSQNRITPEWYRFLAALQRQVGGDQVSTLLNTNFLTYGPVSGISNARSLGSSDNIVLTIDGETATLDLADIGAATSYGSAAHTLIVSIDTKGRVAAATATPLNTTNITEGANLYFTQARARSVLSSGDGVSYDSATGVIQLSGVGFANIRAVTPTDPPAPTATDYTILGDATAGPVTVALPAAAASGGRVLVVKKIDGSANAVQIDPDGAETIDGAASLSITTQFQSVMIQCDGAGWWII